MVAVTSAETSTTLLNEHSFDCKSIGGLCMLSWIMVLPVGAFCDLRCEDSVMIPDVCWVRMSSYLFELFILGLTI